MDPIDDPNAEPVDLPAEPAPDEPAADDLPADLDAMVADIDAELLGIDPAAPAPTPAPAAAATTSPDVARLEGMLAEQRATIAALQERLTGQPAPAEPASDPADPKAIEAAVAADPDVQALNRDIAAADAERTAARTRNEAIIVENNAFADRITQLDREYQTAEPHRQSAIILERQDIYHKMAALTTEYNGNANLQIASRNHKAVLSRHLSQAKSAVESRIEAARNQQLTQAESRAQARADFTNAFDEISTVYGLDRNSTDPKVKERSAYFYETVRTRLSDWLGEQPGRGLDSVGMIKAVKILLGQDERMGVIRKVAPQPGTPARPASPRPVVQPRGAAGGTRRAPTTGPGSNPAYRTPTRPDGSPVYKSSEDALEDPEFVRARANAVFNRLPRPKTL